MPLGLEGSDVSACRPHQIPAPGFFFSRVPTRLDRTATKRLSASSDPPMAQQTLSAPDIQPPHSSHAMAGNQEGGNQQR